MLTTINIVSTFVKKSNKYLVKNISSKIFNNKSCLLKIFRVKYLIKKIL